jgi:hypothetical protein
VNLRKDHWQFVRLATRRLGVSVDYDSAATEPRRETVK